MKTWLPSVARAFRVRRYRISCSGFGLVASDRQLCPSHINRYSYYFSLNICHKAAITIITLTRRHRQIYQSSPVSSALTLATHLFSLGHCVPYASLHFRRLPA